jgi:hypothetical protein
MLLFNQETDKQPEGIPVAIDGVAGVVSLGRQIVTEK